MLVPKHSKRIDKRQTHCQIYDNIYVVQRIVNRHVINGVYMYQIKWEGYGSQENTMEPLGHLQNVLDMVAGFQETLEGQKNSEKFSITGAIKTQKDIISNELNGMQQQTHLNKAKPLQRQNTTKQLQKTQKNIQKKIKKQKESKRKKNIKKLKEKGSQKVIQIDDQEANQQQQQIKRGVIDWLRQFEQEQSYNLLWQIKSCQDELKLQKNKEKILNYNEQSSDWNDKEMAYWGSDSKSDSFSNQFDCTKNNIQEHPSTNKEYYHLYNSPSSSIQPSEFQIQSLLSEICKKEESDHVDREGQIDDSEGIMDKRLHMQQQLTKELIRCSTDLQTRDSLEKEEIDHILSDQYLQIKQFLGKKPQLKQIKRFFRVSSEIIFEIQLDSFQNQSRYISTSSLCKYYPREFDYFMAQMHKTKQTTFQL